MGTPKKNDSKNIPKNTDAEEDDDDFETTPKKVVDDDEDDFDVPLDDDLGFETFSDEDDDDDF